MPLAMRVRVPMLHGMTIMASPSYDPLATFAPMSSLFCCWILVALRANSLVTTSFRPEIPSSSAITRKPLSETIRLMLPTRSSRSRVSSRCLGKMEPLAPVMATVRFRFFVFGDVIYGSDLTQIVGEIRSRHFIVTSDSGVGRRGAQLRGSPNDILFTQVALVNHERQIPQTAF